MLVSPRERDIGMVFQSYAVWPHMTVRAERGLSAEAPAATAAPAATSTPRSTTTLELVGLGDYAERPVTSLSGGQMQRVALARSLVYRPQLSLLDEPLVNLDAKLRIRLRDELRRILKQTGMTGLYVTHDQSEAVVLGDRIGVMREGKLLQMAPPAEIYNRPADPFVANFTGASNVLLGKVLARSGRQGAPSISAPPAASKPGRRSRIAVGERARVTLRRRRAQRLGEQQRAANAFSGPRVVERRYQVANADRSTNSRAGRPAGLEALELVLTAAAPRGSKRRDLR